MQWRQVLSVYLAAAVIAGYGVCFFVYAVPYLALHSKLINGDWSEILGFCLWMLVPWALVRQMRRRARERALEGIHHLNTRRPIT
jgi:hypothetical protein